jgi:hypothetical protein
MTAANDIVASPAVANEIAYAASVDGNLYAITHDDSAQPESPNEDTESDDGA